MKIKGQKHKYLINIFWDDHDNIYVAQVPELPGCSTHGNSIKEAASHAEDAIASWIEGAKKIGKTIPEPLTTKEFSGKFNLRIKPHLHRKISLRAKAQGKSLNGLIEEILGSA